MTMNTAPFPTLAHMVIGIPAIKPPLVLMTHMIIIQFDLNEINKIGLYDFLS